MSNVCELRRNIGHFALKLIIHGITKLREIFRFLDRDSGGTVSGQELSSLIRLVSSNYTEHQIKLLMNKADMNGDGEMGFEEFVRLLSSEPTDAQQETSATREAFEVFDAVSPYTHCDISE
ncbi:Calmodulin [Fasciolopsis buskii]|uniref:Calmodulin n=1 Tax=Fasciolopsis buskii TaxID=27845 RepID=A0A8E0RXC1_9TREM|nr:Calmodulin [Fasciolopsis buski]